MAPVRSGTGRDRREGAPEATAACLADPVSGLIDGDQGLDQVAIHQEREWDASMDLPPPTMIMLMRISSLPLVPWGFCSFRSRHQAGVDAHD